ncbi:hypothetical protein NXC12_PD00014 (plasmid) [Rhizobium etli]|uniref:Uncharacterized protein n=1 Tax=Rhizobium etli TaxID=29449 RepID=A0AAN1BMI9_RHIET|nr:hypothetical protein NXC12_PD00014 [Rhizobium etli]
MNPQPPELHDIIQVVIAYGEGRLTQDQKDCLTFLIKINHVKDIFLFKGKEFVSLPVPQI